ncbi:hypothetical protein F4778DRAFT_295496 [Xylariomycetidae sp. FL2044]|nr:hypothetical protein F4778DRAFT_295496 [Xylariomycetidae sp. FL2044]
MAANYGEVPQDDSDDDRNTHLPPTRSYSPMPFLSSVKSTFTPLSMDSEIYPREAVQENTAANSHHDPTATAKTGGISVRNMIHSLSSARTTNDISAEYDLLSRGSAPSPASSSSPNMVSPIRSPAVDSGPHSSSGPTATRNYDVKTATTSTRQGSVSQPTSPTSESSRPVLHQPTVVRPKPIVRTASTKSVSLRHPTPDLNTRSSSYASNIAQLEATAEQLSMTSSIDDAIRDLHDEQKRNESRRSSILAASISSIPETNEPPALPISRQVSAASSILETNNAARFGGYSPAGYVMSPNHSLRSNGTRLRSGSTGLPRVEPEADTLLTRNGPGNSSVRSVRSVSKPTLTDIAEMEPTALNKAAMDAADKLLEEPEEDEPLKFPHLEDIDLTPNAHQDPALDGRDYWDRAVAEANQEYNHNSARRPGSAGSDGTYAQAERAFADFDGAHCSPDADWEDALSFPNLFASPVAETPFLSPLNPDSRTVEQEPDLPRPIISRPIGPPTVRPKSYMDPETGETMMYYPARVPMMLNLPQKLSKKPKAAARNQRRSQVLSAMPEANRQSWLPEIVPQQSLDPLGSSSDLPTPVPEIDAEPVDSSTQLLSGPESFGLDQRKSRMSMLEPGDRKSQAPVLDGLPPQLRASAFFDLPSESTPAIQLKDGSATATLDSILDASAKAPVSAFTDHAFAGSLGSEIYGTDKKRKSLLKRNSTANLLEPKRKSSFMHLRKPSALSRHSYSYEERQDTITGSTGSKSLKPNDSQDEERQRLSGSVDGDRVGEEGDEIEEEELLYNGPPTTLLAELQIRKQQQKLRTRPVVQAYPNGLHSTLLELDTVAEMERQARKGKKVNLAWEDPAADPTNLSDDEDVPLGVLMATKGQSTDFVTAMADLNRPPGLMERREMEDNEPLSRRRDRIQGREAGPVKRVSMMTLNQSPNMSGGLGPPSPALRIHTPEEDEIEGETLGERMRRLRARDEAENPLPRTRPVSSAFSAELFSQLGDTFKEEGSVDKIVHKEKGKEKEVPKEEEETLGQRRRRLQAEKEARDREMASAALTGRPGEISPKLVKRRSLADVLGTYGGSKAVLRDPRAEAQRAKDEEGTRYKREQGQKMAALRSQMPTNLTMPNLNRSGGYASGRFNDGIGGAFGQSRANTAMSGYIHGQAMGVNTGFAGNGYPMGGMMGGGSGPTSTYGMPNGYGNMMPNAYAMPMQSTGHVDRVERWRQSVHP